MERTTAVSTWAAFASFVFAVWITPPATRVASTTVSGFSKSPRRARMWRDSSFLLGAGEPGYRVSGARESFCYRAPDVAGGSSQKHFVMTYLRVVSFLTSMYGSMRPELSYRET